MGIRIERLSSPYIRNGQGHRGESVPVHWEEVASHSGVVPWGEGSGRQDTG